MKILESSNIEVRCPQCKALLAVEFSDVHYNDVGHSGSTYSCVCADCGHVIPLDSKQIPHRWVASLARE